MDWKEVKYPKGSEALSSEFPDYDVVEHKIGNQTDATENANKFFSLEVHKSSNGKWRVYSNYGRVDGNEYTGVVGVYGPSDEQEMRQFFASKFKSKVRPSKGYVEVKFIKASVGSPKARLKTYDILESEVPAEKKVKLTEETKKTNKIDIHPTLAPLVEQWYRESSTAITKNSAVTITKHGLSTPLGVLTFSQLNKGKTVLGSLVQAIKDNNTKEIKKLSGEFYTHIPTTLGRKITDADLITTDTVVQQKLDLIQMMNDALDVGGITYTSDLDTKYLELGTKIEYIPKTDAEWKRIEHKIKSTRGSTHYGTTDKVLNVFRLEMSADRNRYNGCTIGNEQELFHGSRNCNLVGILKSGMRIAPPEAPRSGLAFGFGAYFASHSSKSINYSLYPFPGVENSKNCFVFLFNVKLGKQLIKQWGSGDEHEECKKKMFDSTWGKEGNGLQYSEYIIYNVAQCTGCYIVELQR